MILIISDPYDETTIDVCEWLSFNKKEFILFNNFSQTLSLSLSNSVKKEKNKINSIWIRRFPAFDIKIENKQVSKQIRNELLTFFGGLKINSQIKVIGGTNNLSNIFEINKLESLQVAKNVGLIVPEYIFTSQKQEMIKFYKRHKKIITKPASNAVFIRKNNFVYKQYTSIVKLKELNHISLSSIPTFLQKYIEKTFEIRVFFHKNTFYSAAIFSQNNKKTKIDFRVYDDSFPNKIIPYNLDNETKRKIITFCKKIKINSGSLDFIKSSDGNLYFLEINPFGQFAQVSYPCNYIIEREIAKYLINVHD